VDERAVHGRRRQRTAGQPLVVIASEACGIQGGQWQRAAERVQCVGIESQIGRQLPQNRSKLALERQNARGEEVRKRLPRLAQPAHVGDEAAAFDREQKILWRGIAPGSISFRSLQRIERRVQFDTAEARCRERQLVALRQTGRIEVSSPRRVVPAGRTDARTRLQRSHLTT